MTFSAKTRHLMLSAAVLIACAIQLVRGYKLLIVIVAAVTFLAVGNLMIYLTGSKQRAIRRQQKRDYYAGNS